MSLPRKTKKTNRQIIADMIRMANKIGPQVGR